MMDWSLRDDLRKAKERALREAGDDHFYGPWKGGAKAAGGRPAEAGGMTTKVNPATPRDRWSDHDSLISEMEAKYPGASFSDAKKMPIQIASDAVDTIDVLNDRFGVPPNFQGIRVQEGPPGTYAEVKRVNPDVKGSAVYLYNNPFASQSAMNAAAAHSAGSKHFVERVGATPRDFARTTVVHEMGHQYMGLNLHSRLGPNRDAAVRKELEPFFRGQFLPNYGSAHISKYARRPGAHEAWAEMFVAAVTGYPTQSGQKDPMDYPKVLKGILDKHYPVSFAESFREAKAADDWPAAKREPIAATIKQAGHICGFARQNPDLPEPAGLKEAGDDHFYGPWSGGSKGAGGRPAGGTSERLTKATAELQAAKAAVAKRPDSRAAQTRLDKAQQEATVAHWVANPTKAASTAFDPKAQMEKAKALPTPSLSQVKGKTPAGSKVEWVKKPEPIVTKTGYPMKQGSVKVEPPGYLPKTWPVTQDADGLTVGTPWNSASMTFTAREAGEDHFYGPWKGGGKGAGGRPSESADDRAWMTSVGMSKTEIADQFQKWNDAGAPLAAERAAMVASRRLFDETRPGDVITATYQRADKDHTVSGMVKAVPVSRDQPMVVDANGKRESFLRSEVMSLKQGAVREAAGEDHFYGPWSGGAKGAGGRPAAGGGTKVRNPETDMEYRAQKNAEFRKQMAADEMARLESGAIPSGVYEGKRIELDRLERPGVYRVKVQGSGFYREVPASKVSDIRDRHGQMRSWDKELRDRPNKATISGLPNEFGRKPHGLRRRADGSIVREATIREFDERTVRRDGEGQFTFSTGGAAKSGEPRNEEAGDLPNRLARRFGVPPERMNTEEGRAALQELQDALAEREKNGGWSDALRARVIAARTYLATGHSPSKENVQKSIKTGKSVGRVVLWSDAREAGDEHFYGPWKGGPKASGGGPMTPAQQQAADAAKLSKQQASWKAQQKAGVQPPDEAIARLRDGEFANVAPESVGPILDKLADSGENLDLTELSVNGTMSFGGDGLGIARSDMPQVPSAGMPGFLDQLRSEKVSVTSEKVNPRTLSPVQKEVSAAKAGRMLHTARTEPADKMKSILVSKDNYVLDGHHHWGAMTALSFERDGVVMPVTRIGLNHRQALDRVRAYANEQGYAQRGLQESESWYAEESQGGTMKDPVKVNLREGRRHAFERPGRTVDFSYVPMGGFMSLTFSDGTSDRFQTSRKGGRRYGRHVTADGAFGAEQRLFESAADALQHGGKRYVTGARLHAFVREAEDDHFYGPWKGPARAAGGHPAGEDSLGKYVDDKGRWDPDRLAVHERWYESTMEGVPVSDNPTVYMTGGGAASGKTQALLKNPDAAIPDAKHAAHVDPDAAKAALPEYQAGIKAGYAGAAGYAHEESSTMAKTGVSRALAASHDVVYDSVGDSGIDKLEAKVQTMRDQGAKSIVARYAIVPLPVARARAEERGRQTGRVVNDRVLTKGHADVRSTLQGAISRGIFDDLKIYDTNVPMGTAPTLVASYAKKGGLTVHNQDMWTSYTSGGYGA